MLKPSIAFIRAMGSIKIFAPKISLQKCGEAVLYRSVRLVALRRITIMPFDEETERRLLDNDPTLTCLDLRPSASEISQQTLKRLATALNSSTHIEGLVISFHLFDDICTQFLSGRIPSPRTTTTSAVALWISKSTSLNTLCLSPSFSRRGTSVYFLPEMLEAVRLRSQRGSKALRILSLCGVHLRAHDFVQLLRHGSVKLLGVYRCAISKGLFLSEDDAVQRVAESFAANTTLLRLAVDVAHHSIVYYASIIASLRANPCIQILEIGRQRESRSGTTIPIAVADALVSLFWSSTCSLQALRVNSFLLTDDSLARIAQGLQTSPMKMPILYMSRCTFDEASGRHFCSIFTSPGCTTSKLYLSRNVFPIDSRGNSILVDLVTAHHSGLRNLVLEDFGHSATENGQFQAILQGLANASCRIQRLELDKTISDAQFDALLNALPNFQHLESIGFTMKSADHWKTKVLVAFRRNSSLQGFDLVEGHHLWSVHEASLLKAYQTRNRTLRGVLQSESMAQQFGRGRSLLPSLLSVSMNGSNAMGLTRAFCALVQVDDQVGPSSRSAKRTCPMKDSDGTAGFGQELAMTKFLTREWWRSIPSTRPTQHSCTHIHEGVMTVKHSAELVP
jgi:hypothetical protein